MEVNPHSSLFFPVESLKEATKTTLLEDFFLWFIKPRYFVENGTTLMYKSFRGKMYIINHWINAPEHFNCRCVTERPKDKAEASK